jgi:hypothetical protein
MHPKPQLAYGKLATNGEEGADMMVSIKRLVFEDAMVGMPVKKCQIARPGQMTHWIKGSLKGGRGRVLVADGGRTGKDQLKYNRTD